MPELGPSLSVDLSDIRRRLGDAFDCFTRPGRNVALIVPLALVAVLGIWFASNRSDGPPPETYLPRASSSTTTPASPVSNDQVVVHVSGAVAKPGVYKVPSDARVGDAVDIAGGVTPDADLDRVNLAAKVTDGQRVFIVRKGQVAVPTEVAPSSSTTGESKGPLDLNTATEKDLEELPGVGPATAKTIVDYRTKNGPFKSTQDLLKIRGIGQAKFAQLRDLVRV